MGGFPGWSRSDPWIDPTLKAGELLEGRFRILREVAEGGMAIVYEAMDES